MRNVPPTLLRALSILGVVALCLAAGPAPAQTTHPLYLCANRVAGGLRDFTQNAAQQLGDCETERLKTGTVPSSCAPDSSDWGNLIDDLSAQVNHAECGTAGNPADQSASVFRALCPLESRYTGLFLTNTTAVDAGTVRDDLTALMADLFATEYPGCTRPTSNVSSGPLRECALQLADVATREAEELYQCFVSCERANLGDSDACVNDNTGNPTNDGLLECVASNGEDVADITTDCKTDAQVQALGCPLGATTVDGLVAALATRLQSYAQSLSFGTFHSSCRTSIVGPPPELVPANVTLLPSGTTKQVSCGQTLDATFFGSDNLVRFDTDLDCSAATTAVNGIVIAKNTVTISGNGKTRQINGPSRKSLRTGAGVLVAQGIKRVTITGFRRIANFSIGVLAQGDNRKLKVEKSTLFRNLQAGVRSTSPKTKVVEVVADRNGIGFDLSGNDSLIKTSQARGSEPQSSSAAEPLSPGWGFRLSGSDTDADGINVRCTQCTAETSRVGFVVQGTGQLVENSFSRSNVGDGVWVEDTNNRFRNNSVKQNSGHGIVVKGTANHVNKNQSDENGGSGFVVEGEGNELLGNGSGSLTDNGNSQLGFLITAANTILDTNEAEANLGGGFSLQATAALFKGNRAESNGGIGFDLVASGNSLDSNTAEKSTGMEWQVAAGNIDASGNKANGKTIAIPLAGGSFE